MAIIDLSEKIKEISISEFFEKNRHLLGYENPAKALYTVVKEFVDNSIDACLEARILPDIYVKIKKLENDRFRVRVEDNGPGISPKKLPIAFGKFLVGSKFYRLRQSIGTQGIGAKGAILYSQLTTNKPAYIYSATVGSKEIHYFELMIDVLKNEPIIVSHEVKENKNNWHGLSIEVEFEGRYTSKVDEYLELLWLVNPYVRIVYEKDGEKRVFERITKELPIPPREIKPHPYGIELGILKRLAMYTKANDMVSFLIKEFSRIGKDTALKILKLAKIDANKNPRELTNEELERLFNSMQKVKIRAPPTNCLSPINDKYLLQALKKLFPAESYAVVTRKPSVYRGFPFQVQAAIVYGVKNNVQEEETLGVRILRFANHTPLLYNLYDCAITKTIMQINWNQYGISQSGNLPNEPIIILVDFLSVWIPYKSEGKQAIAEYPEIMKEIELAIREAARKIYGYIRKKRKLELLKEKRGIFERYIPEIAKQLSKVSKEDENILLQKLKEIADKKVPELFKLEEEIKS
ncbi:MAG: DNA topoisomerase VI subunit B [Candidatus Aenigmatarchaeota archaeon]